MTDQPAPPSPESAVQPVVESIFGPLKFAASPVSAVPSVAVPSVAVPSVTDGSQVSDGSQVTESAALRGAAIEEAVSEAVSAPGLVPPGDPIPTVDVSSSTRGGPTSGPTGRGSTGGSTSGGVDLATLPPPSGQAYPPSPSAAQSASTGAGGLGIFGNDAAPPASIRGGSHRTRARLGAFGWFMVASLAFLMGLTGALVGVGLSNLSVPKGGDDLLVDAGEDPNPGAGLQSDQTRTDAPLDNGSVEAVAAEVVPRTVQVLVEQGGQNATGSGFVLDSAGHVVTNNHVIEMAAEKGSIQLVTQDGRRLRARLVGRSPVYDLAVLFASGARDLEPAALGSSEELAVGEEVVAVGSPLGLTATVTSGIVSALNRPVSVGDAANSSSYINAVQTDAAINPGNSGGPLVNLDGQVVGVNSAIATAGEGSGQAGNIGVGFAIPMEQVKRTADEILTDGEATYPIIGTELAAERSFGIGAEVAKVTDGSPADQAELRAGDVIIGVDGQRVIDNVGLIVAIRKRQPGEVVTLVVNRGSREFEVELKLDSRVG